MNREFKFRIWEKDSKRFRTKEQLDSTTLMPNYGLVHGNLKHPTLGIYYADVVIQQYTGRKDKHGKEIYEGDIVNGIFSIGISTEIKHLSKAEILFNNNVYMFDIHGSGYALPLYALEDIEVVGNIFESKK